MGIRLMFNKDRQV